MKMNWMVVRVEVVREDNDDDDVSLLWAMQGAHV